jgi:hypothetical protein
VCAPTFVVVSVKGGAAAAHETDLPGFAQAASRAQIGNPDEYMVEWGACRCRECREVILATGNGICRCCTCPFAQQRVQLRKLSVHLRITAASQTASIRGGTTRSSSRKSVARNASLLASSHASSAQSVRWRVRYHKAAYIGSTHRVLRISVIDSHVSYKKQQADVQHPITSWGILVMTWTQITRSSAPRSAVAALARGCV